MKLFDVVKRNRWNNWLHYAWS